MSITAGSRQRRHFTRSRPLSSGAAGDDRADLDDVVVDEALVAGRERVVADHEHRLRARRRGRAGAARPCGVRAARAHGAGCGARPSWGAPGYCRTVRTVVRYRTSTRSWSSAASLRDPDRRGSRPGGSWCDTGPRARCACMRRMVRAPTMRIVTIIQTREPADPRRAPTHVRWRRMALHTSDPPDLEHGLTLARAPLAEPVRDDDGRHRDRDRDDGRRHLDVLDAAVDLTAQLAQLRFDVVPGDLRREPRDRRVSALMLRSSLR